jgi:nucleotide-binding universal stress UspA family protein
MATIHTILRPMDCSDAAKPALRLAQRLAHDNGARLFVLNVVAPPVLYGEIGMTIPIPETQEEILERHRIQLEELVAGTGTECRVAQGLAGPEINRIDQEVRCGVAIVG